MSEAPKRIWARADRRKHWQAIKPDDNQHTGHWKEYIRKDLYDALQAENERLRKALGLKLGAKLPKPQGPTTK